MYKRVDPQVPLSNRELSLALRKHLNAYQIQNLDRLTSGRDHWEWYVGRGATRRDFVMKILETIRSQKGPIFPPEATIRLVNGSPQGDPVQAFILDGRWVARCLDCAGQEVVDLNEPEFSCLNPSCLNYTNQHYPRPVRFPSRRIMKDVTETLLARPNPVNRSWDVMGFFGSRESPQDLIVENTSRGLPAKVAVEEMTHGI